MLEDFTIETFAARVGERFRIRFEAGGPAEAELVEVTPVGLPAEGVRTPFSLVFRGPAGASQPQRIYRVEHDELGDFELFLVPIAPDDEGPLYEAVFA
jgi:hypothetical protein